MIHKFYLAPLEGITTYTVRNAFARFFPGADKYFTPFIPAGKNFSQKIKADLNPENNKGIYLVPQVISNNAAEMPEFEKKLMAFGYEEYNLNLGCPSGTVVSKNRGSGFLRNPYELDRFLDEVYSKTNMKLSIKTRIGLDDESEWEELLKVYLKYPISELIIHPRLKSDLYRGEIRFNSFLMADEAFDKVDKEENVPLCYNGDINIPSDLVGLNMLKHTESVMIGRGMLRRPWLINQLKTGEVPDDLNKRIYDFMEYMYHGFEERGFGQRDIIMHLKEIWSYLGDTFEDATPLKKKILKSKTEKDYTEAVGETLKKKILI